MNRLESGYEAVHRCKNIPPTITFVVSHPDLHFATTIFYKFCMLVILLISHLFCSYAVLEATKAYIA